MRGSDILGTPVYGVLQVLSLSRLQDLDGAVYKRHSCFDHSLWCNPASIDPIDLNLTLSSSLSSTRHVFLSQVTKMSEYRAQHDTEKTHYITEGINAVEAEHALPYKDSVGATFDDLDLHNTLASKADDSDGKTTWSFRKLLAAISLAGFYVGSAIPTLLIGASLQYIAEDLDAEFASWLITANTLVVAASTPFVAYLTDLVGPSTVQRQI